MLLFGIGRLGIPELVLILAIALIIFGPRKLPEIGKSIGKGIKEFRSATSEIKKSVDSEDHEETKADSKEKTKHAEDAHTSETTSSLQKENEQTE